MISNYSGKSEVMDERDWIIIRLMIDASQGQTYNSRALYNIDRTILYMQRRVGIRAFADAIDKIHEERRNRNAKQAYR